mmetsp:Transcript_1596/g.2812  ORF Transcript_1596/g.2812 Transcript_1596/m.2812 type:complete len:339 (+) Transcript_1596:455-1471(+)
MYDYILRGERWMLTKRCDLSSLLVNYVMDFAHGCLKCFIAYVSQDCIVNCQAVSRQVTALIQSEIICRVENDGTPFPPAQADTYGIDYIDRSKGDCDARFKRRDTYIRKNQSQQQMSTVVEPIEDMPFHDVLEPKESPEKAPSSHRGAQPSPLDTNHFHKRIQSEQVNARINPNVYNYAQSRNGGEVDDAMDSRSFRSFNDQPMDMGQRGQQPKNLTQEEMERVILMKRQKQAQMQKMQQQYHLNQRQRMNMTMQDEHFRTEIFNDGLVPGGSAGPQYRDDFFDQDPRTVQTVNNYDMQRMMKNNYVGGRGQFSDDFAHDMRGVGDFNPIDYDEQYLN